MTAVEDYVFNILSCESSGHDYRHALRVCKNIELLSVEGCDVTLCLVCGMVHDIIDKKVSNDCEKSKKDLERFLLMHYDKKFVLDVFEIITNMSYSDNKVGYFSNNINGQIVQDADRLEAIGAIGIARTFLYSGSNGLSIYDSIKHFDEKLFKLKNLMNTKKAHELALKRTEFMEQFYLQFKKEL